MPVSLQAQDKPKELFDERLNRIRLLPEPTIEQCEAYLDQLDDLARSFGLTTNSFNREYELLTSKVSNDYPDEYFDLLVSEVVRSTRLSRAAGRTLSKLDLEPDVFKKGILAQLEADPALIRVVLANGWSQDARQIIAQMLNADTELPTRDWFVAAVELKDPKLYARLHERAIRLPYAVDCIIALEALPDYDLANTIDEVYTRHKDRRLKLESYASGYYPQIRLRAFAAETGNIDALGELVKDLKSDGLQFSAITDNYYDSSRLAVIKLIDFRGDNSAIQAWFKANRDDLVFDRFRRRFVLAGDG